MRAKLAGMRGGKRRRMNHKPFLRRAYIGIVLTLIFSVIVVYVLTPIDTSKEPRETAEMIEHCRKIGAEDAMTLHVDSLPTARYVEEVLIEVRSKEGQLIRGNRPVLGEAYIGGFREALRKINPYLWAELPGDDSAPPAERGTRRRR